MSWRYLSCLPHFQERLPSLYSSTSCSGTSDDASASAWIMNTAGESGSTLDFDAPNCADTRSGCGTLISERRRHDRNAVRQPVWSRRDAGELR